MRIAEAAGKHGITDENMLHGLRNSIRRITMDDMALFIGPDQTGALLEIGVLNPDTDPAIIHAMPLQENFYRFL